MSTEALHTSEAAGRANPRKRDWREFIREEAKSFAVIFVYLAVVFGVLGLHQWIVLSSKGISYQFYGLALLNALVLAKVILIAEGFNFANSLKHQPLAYRVAYKCLAFTFLLVVAYIAEEVLVGRLHGESLAQAFPEIGDGSVRGWLAMAVILCVALVPFFAFREVGREIGGPMLKALFFTGRPKTR
jgi:hypothetical protein